VAVPSGASQRRVMASAARRLVVRDHDRTNRQLARDVLVE